MFSHMALKKKILAKKKVLAVDFIKDVELRAGVEPVSHGKSCRMLMVILC